MVSFNSALLLLAAASLSAVDAWNCACGFYCPELAITETFEKKLRLIYIGGKILLKNIFAGTSFS